MKMKKVEISEADKTKALNKVVNLCHANLFTRDGEQVLHYLTEVRGLSEQTIRKFKLGLFPEYPEVAANAAGVRNALRFSRQRPWQKDRWYGPRAKGCLRDTELTGRNL